MNYLAHLYLSGSSEQRMVGNFIGDYVKGKRYLEYPKQIGEGIVLHRSIDSYTDSHALVAEAKDVFRSVYGRYSGVVVDIIYDYFLATNWEQYSMQNLPAYTKYVHAVLLSNYFKLPMRVQAFLPFLIQHKRLASYSTLNGIKQTLDLMAKHRGLPNHGDKAIQIVRDNKTALNANFQLFFEQAIEEFMAKNSDSISSNASARAASNGRL